MQFKDVLNNNKFKNVFNNNESISIGSNSYKSIGSKYQNNMLSTGEDRTRRKESF